MNNLTYHDKWYDRTYYIIKNKTSNKHYIGQHRNYDNIGTKYLGSGVKWISHCHDNGGYTSKNIEVVWKKYFCCKTSAELFLIAFEKMYPGYYLSENSEWLNQMPESTDNNTRPSLNKEIARKLGETRKRKIADKTIISCKWYRNETEDIYCLEKDKPLNWWEGRIPTSGNKGQIWYNNGKEQGCFKPGMEPNDWVRGMLPKTNKNYKQYTNGKETKLFYPSKEPNEWFPGKHWSSKNPGKTNVYDLYEEVTKNIPIEEFNLNNYRYISCSSMEYRKNYKNKRIM